MFDANCWERMLRLPCSCLCKHIIDGGGMIQGAAPQEDLEGAELITNLRRPYLYYFHLATSPEGFNQTSLRHGYCQEVLDFS